MRVIKKVLVTVLLSMSSLLSTAQSNWEAGVRIGNYFGIDATIPIQAEPRLHAAVYFGDGIGLGTYFNWMFALNEGPQGLKFYPGVGPEVFIGDEFRVGVSGDFGAEYSFDFPLTVGIDWRPGISFGSDDNFRSNLGVIARYRFGEGLSFKRVSK
ncbi:MAG: hypothetical protein RIQ47_1215 [Bacteroidota bacterium]|jgi:hypothetical protein